MNAEKEKFETLWGDFVTLIKGKLITISDKQILSTSVANLVLSEAVESWAIKSELNGHWLMKLEEKYPNKVKLIKEILFQDIKFNNVKTIKVLPNYSKTIVPAMGAVIGFVVGKYFELGITTLVCSTIVPVLILYPTVAMLQKKQIIQKIESQIEGYIGQLNKYKDSILSILEIEDSE